MSAPTPHDFPTRLRHDANLQIDWVAAHDLVYLNDVATAFEEMDAHNARLREALRPFVEALAFDDDEPDRCGWCAYLLVGEHHHRCPMPAASAALSRDEA